MDRPCKCPILKKIPSLSDFVKDKDVRYEIVDSLYDPKEEAGILIKQDPRGKIAVKHNKWRFPRYLTRDGLRQLFKFCCAYLLNFSYAKKT